VQPPASGADLPFRSTLDHLLEGFQIIAHDWSYLYVNPAAARHGRRTPEELHGRKMWEAYPGIQDTPLFAVLTRCMRERTATSFENQFTFPNGTTRWFELRVVPVPEGLCVHSFDIQARKDADAALRRLNHELETRVAARTRQLTATNEELEAFSYSVSHDLRAPLRDIDTFVGELRQRGAASLDAESLGLLNRMSEAVDRMGRLMDDLLQFSRMGREALRKQRIRLEDAVGKAREQVSRNAGDRDIRWSIGSLPEVDADPALLHLALVNIFENAVKFTRGRSPARIDVSARSEEVLGEIVLAVHDNGVGFDSRSAGRLFGVFQRLHADAGFEGTGIGLANVRRIVSRHGGRTWAEGTVDGGATFYLALPAG
jgi:PAS domain S-box-containing protein